MDLTYGDDSIGGDSSFTESRRRHRNNKSQSKQWKNPIPGFTSTGSQWFSTWLEDSESEADSEAVHMASVRISDGPALLVDTGSPGNVCGSEWSAEMADAAQEAGRPGPRYQRRQKPLVMSGIGTGYLVATHEVLHAVGLPGSADALHKASELPESRTPGILGQNSLSEKGSFIDCAQKRMYAVGRGGYEIRFSLGSLMYPLKTSKAGHLMLPCAEFGRGEASSEVMTFTVGPHFEEWQELSSESQAVIHHTTDAEGDSRALRLQRR